MHNAYSHQYFYYYYWKNIWQRSPTTINETESMNLLIDAIALYLIPTNTYIAILEIVSLIYLFTCRQFPTRQFHGRTNSVDLNLIILKVGQECNSFDSSSASTWIIRLYYLKYIIISSYVVLNVMFELLSPWRNGQLLKNWFYWNKNHYDWMIK